MPKPCPSCRSQPCAEGRARCQDCLESTMRRLNAFNQIGATREASTRGTVHITSAIVPTPPDRVLIDWKNERELRSWASIPDAKCRPKPKDMRRTNGRKRDAHKPKARRVDLHPAPVGA